MFIEIIEDAETFELAMGKSSFTLRRFDSEVYKRIEKKHMKKQKNHRTGQIFRDVDEYAVNADLLDHMIVGWQGIKSPTTGNDVPCTKETKNKLPGGVKVEIVEACDADSITGDEKKKESGPTSENT